MYRHHDLLNILYLTQATDTAGSAGSPPVSRASLSADLANAHERNRRLNARVQQLERRLSEALGEQAWRESGLGATTDIETLQRQIVALEQTIVELTKTIEERDRELAAARAANRELMIRVNARRPGPGTPAPLSGGSMRPGNGEKVSLRGARRRRGDSCRS